MPRKKRKIGFYYLSVNEGNELVSSYNEVINYINSLQKQARTHDLGNNKFCFLESYETNANQSINKMILKCAKHSYRPNLVHRDTIIERENPKQLQEGEIEKSHIVMKIAEDTISIILDKHFGGVTIRQFVNYLNRFSHNLESEIPIRFGFEIVVKENFLEEIENLHRVTCADVVVDKQLLGSDALNYSNRINQVKHDIVLTVKAKKHNSIEDFARDVFSKFIGGEQSISKIRIVGRNEENNQVVLSTDFIERQEYVWAEFSESTGDVSSSDMFIEMTSVLENFN